MSEKLDKLRASLEKEKERRIKINNRIESLERRIQEAEAAEVNEMVRTAKGDPGTARRPAAAVCHQHPEPGCAVRSRCHVQQGGRFG